MNVQEQVQIQIWLTSLLALLEEGDVNAVKQELRIALGRIEEDRDGQSITRDTDGTAENAASESGG